MANGYGGNSNSNNDSDVSGTASWHEVGKIVSNRYRLGRVLGRGSFGQVFYSEDLKFDPPRSVALKLISNQVTNDAGVREELKREASALARFNHPNILRVLDYEVSDGLSYIVTEFAAGGSLQNQLQPDPTQPMRPLELNVVTRYLDQLSDALDQAHGQGIIHRDIKPQNILLDGQGRPMLADFGLSAAASSSVSSMIDTTPTGTPLYMAPEQWEGQVSKASDIYSLGVVLFQMLTGQTPYKGNPASLAWQHCNAAVPKVTSFAPWLGQYPHLDAVLQMALAKEASQRPRSTRELYNRYMDALQGNPASNDTMNVKLVTPPAQPVVAPQTAWPPMQPPTMGQTAWPPVQPQWGQQDINNSQYSFAPSNYVRPDVVVRPKTKRLGVVVVALFVGVVAVVAIIGGVAALTASPPPVATPTIVVSQANTATVQPTNTATTQPTNTPKVQPTNTARVTSGSIFQPVSKATATPKSTTVPAGFDQPIVTGTLGVTVTLPSKPNNFELTVNQVKTVNAIDSYQAAPDYQFLLLNVTYKSGTGEQFFFTRQMAEMLLRDNQNVTYSYKEIPTYKDNSAEALTNLNDDLQPGERVNGWLTYEVPKTAKGLVFEYLVQTDIAGFTPPRGLFEIGLDNQANYTLPTAPKLSNVNTSGKGKIGDTLDGGNYYLTITKAETSNTLQDIANSSTKADAGKEFLTVFVVVDSKVDKGVTINSTVPQVADAQGFRYDSKNDRQPELDFTENLPIGHKLEGWLTFEVPANDKNLTLEFKALNDNAWLQVAIN